MLIDEILNGDFFEAGNHSASVVPYNWTLFVGHCSKLGVTEDELLADFTQQDIIDLANEPAEKLPLFAKTIAKSYGHKRSNTRAN